MGSILADAAALPLVTLTGSELVEEGLDPRPSETILVTGALGSVGRTAVFAAKARGVRVWAGVRQNQKDAARALGVAGVVALDDEVDCKRLPTLDRNRRYGRGGRHGEAPRQGTAGWRGRVRRERPEGRATSVG